MNDFPRLIALIGSKGSGKTTLAKQLVIHLGYQRIPFASTLKLMLRTMLHEAGASHLEIDSMLDGENKDKPHEILCGKTPRHAMQTLGTEWRNLIGENLWTEIWRRTQSRYSRVCVDDMRFLHEAKAVNELGGKILLITRPSTDINDLHPSEQEFKQICYNWHIDNTNEPEDLLRNFKLLAKGNPT